MYHILLYSRNPDNIVKQFFFQLKIHLKRRKNTFMKYMGSDSQHQEDILLEHLRGEVSCFIEDCSPVAVDVLKVEPHSHLV